MTEGCGLSDIREFVRQALARESSIDGTFRFAQPTSCMLPQPVAQLNFVQTRTPARDRDVRVHGPKVTIVQKQTRCGSIKADPVDLGSEARSKGASVCRTDARWILLNHR